MNSWSETIVLSAPLRDVRLAVPGQGESASAKEQWQAGYEQGRLEGERAVSQQLVQLRNEMHELLHGAIQSLRQTVPQVVRDTENAMIALTFEVARKLVSDMPISATMVEAAVRDALTQVESSSQVTVRLHPADLELLQGAGSPLLEGEGSSPEVRLLSSPDVTRGGCMVQTRFGLVDACRETKFDLLKKALPV